MGDISLTELCHPVIWDLVWIPRQAQLGKLKVEGPSGQRLSFLPGLLHVYASLSPPSSTLPRGCSAPLLGRHS